MISFQLFFWSSLLTFCQLLFPLHFCNVSSYINVEKGFFPSTHPRSIYHLLSKLFSIWFQLVFRIFPPLFYFLIVNLFKPWGKMRLQPPSSQLRLILSQRQNGSALSLLLLLLLLLLVLASTPLPFLNISFLATIWDIIGFRYFQISLFVWRQADTWPYPFQGLYCSKHLCVPWTIPCWTIAFKYCQKTYFTLPSFRVFFKF